MERLIAPSMLSADFGRLGEQFKVLKENGIKVLHVDVMDGLFVPQISFGMPVIKSIRKETDLFFDVHLMIEDPIRYVEAFKECGSDGLTIHYETGTKDLDKTIEKIRSFGMKPGISIKPGTPVEDIIPYIEKVDLILVMTVEPGFGGQSYMHECTEKIRTIRKYIDDHDLKTILEADGGINAGTINEACEAGVEWFVAGNAVFLGDIKKNIEGLNKLINE